MENKISKIQLIEVLSDGIYHKQLLNQYGLNIRLDKNYKFYYLFSKILDEIRNNLLTLSKEKRLNNKDTSDVINNFVETYSSDKVNNTKPCIALIKRSTILKNELKDIQEIINNKDESIASSLSLIMESRYNSYEIENDIAPSEIRIIELPEYSEFLLGLSNFTIVNKNIDIVQDDFKISEGEICKELKITRRTVRNLILILRDKLYFHLLQF